MHLVLSVAWERREHPVLLAASVRRVLWEQMEVWGHVVRLVLWVASERMHRRVVASH